MSAASTECDMMMNETGRSNGVRVPILPSNPTSIDFRQWEPLALAYMTVKSVDLDLITDPPLLSSSTQFLLLQQLVNSADKAAKVESITRLLTASSLFTQHDENNATATSSSSSSIKTKKENNIDNNNKDLSAARKLIIASQHAYSLILTMLPSELVDIATKDNTVVNGYAYSLWHWLHERFRHTAIDAIIELWQELMRAEKKEEKWSDFKARIDDIVSRIVAAGDAVPSGLYVSKLIYNLPDMYAPVVNALIQGGKMDDRNNIDWPLVRTAMESLERQLTRKENNNNESDPGSVAYAAVNRKVTCFNCRGLGHYASSCPNKRVGEEHYNNRNNNRRERRRDEDQSEDDTDKAHAIFASDVQRGWGSGFSF